jgi:hypothetical protein
MSKPKLTYLSDLLIEDLTQGCTQPNNIFNSRVYYSFKNKLFSKQKKVYYKEAIQLQEKAHSLAKRYLSIYYQNGKRL